MKIETKKKLLAGAVAAVTLFAAVPEAGSLAVINSEAADLYSGATVLKNNAPVSSSIGYGITQAYKYTADGSDSFYFEVNSQFSTSVYLYDSNGRKIDNLDTDNYISKEFTGMKGATFYIVVGPSYAAANQYTITAHYEGKKITETEPNDTYAEANTIQKGERVYGYTSGFSDMDCYAFTAPSDGKLKFDLTKENAGADACWTMVVDTKSYTMVSGDARISSDLTDVKKGQKVYVLVKDSNGTAGETYSLAVNFAKLSNDDIASSVASSKGSIKSVSAKKNSITFTAGSDMVYGAKIKYQVRYKKSGALKYKTKNSSKKKITIKGLSRFTEYTFNVRPYVTVSGKKHYGKWSAAKLIRTKK